MKRKRRSQVLWSLVLGIFIMSGCTPNQLPTLESTEPTPQQTGEQVEVPIDLEIPLDDYSASIAVPDFLTEEQQRLYRRAHCVYAHLFGAESTSIDMFPPQDGEARLSPKSVVLDDFNYQLATGRYRNWDDFYRLVHSVFTDDFWNSRNGSDSPIYRNIDGQLGIIELSRSVGYYYNEYFSDEFRLEKCTSDSVEFVVIGHYSQIWPVADESGEEREQQRKLEYDYTIEFPIELLLTEKGWRFNEFHATRTDERAEGE